MTAAYLIDEYTALNTRENGEAQTCCVRILRSRYEILSFPAREQVAAYAINQANYAAKRYLVKFSVGCSHRQRDKEPRCKGDERLGPVQATRR